MDDPGEEDRAAGEADDRASRQGTRVNQLAVMACMDMGMGMSDDRASQSFKYEAAIRSVHGHADTIFSSSAWRAHADVAPRNQQSSVTLVILERLPAIVVVERLPAIVNVERLPAILNVERLPAVDPSRLCSRKVASTIRNTK